MSGHASAAISLSVQSIWPFFVCIAILLLMAGLPIFAAADTPPSPQRHRIAALDGLRGFLALAVFFHHAAMYQDFLHTGVWARTISVSASNSVRFYNVLGPLGVDVFFMITGHLFWSKLLHEQGRPGWLSLYIARIFRIGPVFLFAFAVLVAVIFISANFAMHVGPVMLLRQLSRGLFLGLAPLREINAYPNTLVLLDGVVWTLQYEWFFYIGLLATAWAARKSRISLAFILVLLIVAQFGPWIHRAITPITSAHTIPLWLPHSLSIFRIFLYGMLAASLRNLGITSKLPNTIASIFVIAGFASAFATHNQLGTPFQLLLAVAFFLITSGCTVFGLLTSVPARRLGDISYGIYLLQGLPQAFFYRTFQSLDLSGAWWHWSLTLLAAVTLITLATLTHIWIERPGIDAGRRLVSVLRRSRAIPS